MSLSFLPTPTTLRPRRGSPETARAAGGGGAGQRPARPDGGARSPSAGRRPRVLLVTEGTYPYAVGGVTSWCEVILAGLDHVDWEILPIVAGGRKLAPVVAPPPNAHLLRPIELWSEHGTPRGLRRDGKTDSTALPVQLLRGLMPWRGDLEQLRVALVRCRLRPQSIRREFRAMESWRDFLRELEELFTAGDGESAPPMADAIEAARLYQTLYWVARTAAVPTPVCDLVHITAAGWGVIPAIVEKALHGTPILLTEHGVYVREAYLASIRESASRPDQGHTSPRLALGLTRAAYAAADVVAPVTEANAAWEAGLGVDPARIRIIPNGIDAPDAPTAAPKRARVVSIGRVDPLKDVQTAMLVADEVRRRVPDVRFEYWGPVTPGQDAYGELCHRVHAELELGDAFRMMGSTSDAQGVIRGSDIVLMTSISEAMPMALLEAMSQARPIVATSVGGVPGVVKGCGLIAAPGDVHELAASVTTLLRNPGLAAAMGRHGHERLLRRYTRDRCLQAYGDLIDELAAVPA